MHPPALPVTPESRDRFWQAHVHALGASHLSRCEYCRQHHLSYHALTYWVRKLRREEDRTLPALVEVPVSLSRPSFRLHLGQGYLLEIEPDFDPVSLKRLLGVLVL